MKRPTFAETVDILVKAYLNDTLQHGNCHACAVGNIIASCNGIVIGSIDERKRWSIHHPLWQQVFMTSPYGQDISPNAYNGDAKMQIDSTGYTWKQLAKIENAFELAGGESEDEWMFNGLMAVVDVLAEIHGIDLKSKEEAKLLFAKA